MSADPQHLSEPGPKSASQAEQGSNAGSPWNRGVVPPMAANGIAAARARPDGSRRRHVLRPPSRVQRVPPGGRCDAASGTVASRIAAQGAAVRTAERIGDSRTYGAGHLSTVPLGREACNSLGISEYTHGRAIRGVLGSHDFRRTRQPWLAVR